MGISFVASFGNTRCRATVGYNNVNFLFNVTISDRTKFVVGFNIGNIQLKILALYVSSIFESVAKPSYTGLFLRFSRWYEYSHPVDLALLRLGYHSNSKDYHCNQDW